MKSDMSFVIGLIFFMSFAIMAMIKHSQNQLKDELRVIWMNQQKIYQVLEGNHVFMEPAESEANNDTSESGGDSRR